MIIGILIFVAAVYVIGRFLVRLTSLGEDVDEGHDEASACIRDVIADAKDFFRNTFRPFVMQGGWIVVGIFAGADLMSIALPLFGGTPAWSLLVTVPATLLGGWLVFRATKSPKPSIFLLLLCSSAALFVSGFVIAIAGLYTHEMSLPMLGVLLMLLGIGLIHAFCLVLGGTGVKVIDTSEGLFASVVHFGKAAAASVTDEGVKSLLSVNVPTGPDFFPQEKILPAVNKFFNDVYIKIAPFLILSVAVHHEVVLPIAAAFAFMFPLAWKFLAANGVDVSMRRRRSAQLLEIIVYISAAVLIVGLLRPFASKGINGAFDTLLYNVFVKMTRNLISGLSTGAYHLAAVITNSLIGTALIVAVAATLMVWLWRKPNLRFFAFIPAAAAVLMLLAFTWDTIQLTPTGITSLRSFKGKVLYAMNEPLPEPGSTTKSPATVMPPTTDDTTAVQSSDSAAEAAATEAARAQAFAEEVAANSAPMSQAQVDAALASKKRNANTTKKRGSAAQRTAQPASADGAVAVNSAKNPYLDALCSRHPEWNLASCSK